MEYGINKKIYIKFYKKLGLNLKKYPIVLKQKYKNSFQKFLKNKIVGKFLKQKIKENINFLVTNKCFKGNRHKKNYPVRGQRTHTNAKTRKKYKIT